MSDLHQENNNQQEEYFENNPEEEVFDNSFKQEHNNKTDAVDKKENNGEYEGRGEDEEEELEEIVFEEDGEDKIAKLRKQLKKCRQEKDEYLSALQRLRADYTNQRSKEEKEKERVSEDVKDKILKEVLPIIDSFEMAFADTETWNNVEEKWRGGVEQIYHQLFNFLKANKVEQLNPVGEEFNPHLHEPVAALPVSLKDKENQVLEVLQRGYKRGDKVIRPAKVNVGQYTEEQN